MLASYVLIVNIFFVNNLTALFYNSIIFFTLVVTVYEGRCWPINKYFDPVSCSADERAADGMEAMLTRKGESVEFGECKRWFWNNSPFFGFSINVIADFERNYVNPLFKTIVKKLYCIYSFTDYIELINMNEFVEIKNKLIDYFSQKPEIDTVILFGSFVKETYNKNSDIDIAIHSTRKLNYFVNE